MAKRLPASRAVRSVLGGFWRNTGLYNLVMFAGAIYAVYWIYNEAFADQFRCHFLLVEQLSVPDFMCTGADFGPLGTTPSLSTVIDPPLATVRKVGLAAGLVGAALVSAIATWVYGNVRRVTRLLTFDKQAWVELGATAKVFVSFFLVTLLILWLTLVR